MIRAGICGVEDFCARKDRITKSKKASAAWCWVTAGVCRAEDFALHKPHWIETASRKEAQKLIAAGICSEEEFTHREKDWAAQEDVKSQSEDFESAESVSQPMPSASPPGIGRHYLTEPFHSPPYLSEQLADEPTRLSLIRQLAGVRIQATVRICRDSYCFLSHPDFPENLFCGLPLASKSEPQLIPGELVICKLAIRLNKKIGTWHFNVVNPKRVGDTNH